MTVVSQFTEASTKQASRMLVQLLDRISEERLIQMLQLTKKLSRDPEVLDALGAIQEFFLSNHRNSRAKLRYNFLFSPL